MGQPGQQMGCPAGHQQQQAEFVMHDNQELVHKNKVKAKVLCAYNK
jgi:hypothetical protein